MLLREEGLENVFARHRATRRPPARPSQAWGLEVLALDEREFSRLADRGRLPTARRRRGAPRDPRALRHVARRRPRQAPGQVFRIGHLGDFNDLMLAGTLCGVQMGLRLAGRLAGSAALERSSVRAACSPGERRGP
jgi:alanine-glyoxylate transaminase/serine-glyoxylate transaminase/serine-pyruvate transaminase